MYHCTVYRCRRRKKLFFINGSLCPPHIRRSTATTRHWSKHTRNVRLPILKNIPTNRTLRLESRKLVWLTAEDSIEIPMRWSERLESESEPIEQTLVASADSNPITWIYAKATRMSLLKNRIRTEPGIYDGDVLFKWDTLYKTYDCSHLSVTTEHIIK